MTPCVSNTGARRRRVLASFTSLALAAALVAIACGSDSDDPSAADAGGADAQCTEGEVTCSEDGYELTASGRELCTALGPLQRWADRWSLQ